MVPQRRSTQRAILQRQCQYFWSDPRDGVAIFTVAIGCWIVMVMKGPAKHADSYELIDAEQPREDRHDDPQAARQSGKKYELKA